LLENNITKIIWGVLASNPNAISLLERFPGRIDWSRISQNPTIFTLDYDALKERCSLFKEELFAMALHPSRIEKYLEMGGDIDDM